MFAVKDDDTLARPGTLGAVVVDQVVRYGDTCRVCYIRSPEEVSIGLAEELS